MTVVKLSDDHIWELVQSLWNTVLGKVVIRCRNATAALPNVELTARVQIHGAFNGAVQLSFAGEYAVAITTQIIAVPETSLTTNDVDDVLGELCNILGGGIKSLLPGPSALSLPRVLRDQPFPVPMGQEAVVAQLCCISNGQFVEVQVLETLESASERLPDITVIGNSRATHINTMS